MALIILASQAARSTDRAAIQEEVLNVANAPDLTPLYKDNSSEKEKVEDKKDGEPTKITVHIKAS